MIHVCCAVGVVAQNGFLYVIGGDDGSSNLGSVEFYNPKLDTWTMLPNAMMTGRWVDITESILKPYSILQLKFLI